jgi:hypothetical protein
MSREVLEEHEPSVKLFSYAGRENGLMVVGSRGELRELARQIQAGLERAAHHPATEAWPSQVASAKVVLGPYAESRHLSLSVHVEGVVAAEETVPLRRGSQPVWLTLSTLLFAIVGLLSAVRWVVNGS